jgi:hypothetical protein
MDDRVYFSAPADVNQRDDMFVRLRRDDAIRALARAREQREAALSPGDLFGGVLQRVDIVFGGVEMGTQSHVIDIYRLTASVHITTRNLEAFAQNVLELDISNGTFRYEIHGGVDALDHTREFAGELVRHIPTAHFTAGRDFVTTEPLRKFVSERRSPAHQDEDIVVDIYFNDELIFTAEADADNNPFIAETGRTLNILIVLPTEGEIDDTAALDVRTIVTPWNVVEQWVDWGTPP